MIDKEIIMKLAKQAGMNLTPAQFSGVLEDEVDEFQLVRFAALVAAVEREACAKTVENLYYGMRFQPTKDECATAIRERGNP